MSKVLWIFLLVAAVGFGGCGAGEELDIEGEDGENDTFLAPGGKSDSVYGISEHSPEAIGVLRVVNEATDDEIRQALTRTVRGRLYTFAAAERIIGVRRAWFGDDMKEKTEDDHKILDLEMLDAIPFVGPGTYTRLLALARQKKWAEDAFDPATCGDRSEQVFSTSKSYGFHIQTQWDHCTKLAGGWPSPYTDDRFCENNWRKGGVNLPSNGQTGRLSVEEYRHYHSECEGGWDYCRTRDSDGDCQGGYDPCKTTRRVYDGQRSRVWLRNSDENMCKPWWSWGAPELSPSTIGCGDGVPSRHMGQCFGFAYRESCDSKSVKLGNGDLKFKMTALSNRCARFFAQGYEQDPAGGYRRVQAAFVVHFDSQP